MANAFGGVTALAQTGGQVANMTNGGVGAGAPGSGFSLFSPSSWLDAGKSLFSGFSNGFSSLWGGSAFNPSSGNFVGPPIEGQQFEPQFGGYASSFQQLIGVLGGVAAGFSRF